MDIEEVRRLTLGPTDTLVLKLASEPSEKDLDLIRHHLRQVLINGQKFMVLGPEMEISVIEHVIDPEDYREGSGSQHEDHQGAPEEGGMGAEDPRRSLPDEGAA